MARWCGRLPDGGGLRSGTNRPSDGVPLHGMLRRHVPMKLHRWPALALAAAAVCGVAKPPAPQVPAGQTESITGRERIGWDQSAANQQALASLSWALYIDGVRVALEQVTCDPASGAQTFACAA